MKTIASVFVIVLASALVAAADDATRFETYAGYTYLRVNSATNVPAFSANGGDGQFVINANNYLGFVMDLGATHNGNIGDTHIDSTISNYLFGPRVSLRRSRVIPFAHFLMGGAHASNSIRVSAIPVPPSPGQPIYIPGQGTIPANTPVTLRSVASQTAFSFAFGGGLDLKINKHMAFRPVQLEWMLTRFQNYRTADDNNQHDLRYSAGVNFTFGAR
jgi:opacity protein-like surface antigen